MLRKGLLALRIADLIPVYVLFQSCHIEALIPPASAGTDGTLNWRPTVTMSASTVVIDSHLHVWSNGETPFPYAAGQDPPTRLQRSSRAEDLIPIMDEAGVQGALVVQPINHKFDHSYVASVLRTWPGRFKGMCLANPNLSPEEACADLERLKMEGFCGIRFNPYLWPEGQWGDRGMADPTGMRMYRKAAELGMPVGVMCFKGLGMHLTEIKTLLQASPETKLIIDHFGFFLQGGKADEEAWHELLAMARYPQVFVKTSASFRVSQDGYPYPDLHARLVGLLEAYGSNRLLWGSDYPFVADGQCGYIPAKEAMENSFGLTSSQIHDIMGGTAMKLFGGWGGADN